jgi:hypothetical protein
MKRFFQILGALFASSRSRTRDREIKKFCVGKEKKGRHMSEASDRPEVLLDDGENPYAIMLRNANAEIERFTGGLTTHLAWYKKLNPANDQVLLNFIDEISRSVGVLPKLAFKTLLDLLVATHRHIWVLWLVREELPPRSWTGPFPPDPDRAN